MPSPPTPTTYNLLHLTSSPYPLNPPTIHTNIPCSYTIPKNTRKEKKEAMTSHSNTPQWLIYALSSGFCAALNGVFAKLTTTQLTSTWATAISTALGGGGEEEGGKFVIIVEGLVRGVSYLFSLFSFVLFLFLKFNISDLQILNSSSSSSTSSSTPSCGVYSPMHSVWHPVPSE